MHRLNPEGRHTGLSHIFAFFGAGTAPNRLYEGKTVMESSTAVAVQDTASMIWSYLPSLLGALAVLVIGWVLAAYLAKLARKGIAKSKIVGRIGRLIDEDGPESPETIEKWLGHGVFVILMLFVLVGFFDVLGLEQITQPVAIFLNEFFQYLPRLIGPAVLVLIAWAVATFLRAATKKAMAATKIDDRISDDADLADGKRVAIGDTAGEAIYWLTFLLFLPAVLSALDMGGLLEPVRSVVDKLLGYLPNLMAAGLILVIGWLGARIIRKIVTNLLHAAGADDIGKKADLQDTLGRYKISELVGLVIYVLIFVPVIISALNALELEAITRPASAMLDDFLAALPDLFAGILLLVIAVVVAKIVGRFASGLLAGIGFDTVLTKIGVPADTVSKGRPLSDVAGFLLTVAIILFATVEAFQLIGFSTIAEILAAFLVFAGHILLGLLIVALGLFLAKLVAEAIKDTKIPNAGLLSRIARVAIIVLATVMGLGEMGLGDEIISLAFGLTLGAVAVSCAIAFGIGGRETAAQIVSKWAERGITDEKNTDN